MPSLSPPLTSTDASIIATKPYQNNSYPQNQLSNPRPWALQRFSPSSRWRLSLLHSVSDQTFMAEKLSDDSILSVNPKPSKCFSSKLIDLLELLVVKLMHDASLPLRYLSGNFAPLRDETPPVKDLPVHGFLPECLNGIFRRVGPNPKFDPLAGYHWFDGDG
uniref:Carotenoid oxygenase n=2 Tax=Brassica oleracea var. oleracea TaxID=109376 RepID=A0A0D3DVJ9_BRAOL